MIHLITVSLQICWYKQAPALLLQTLTYNQLLVARNKSFCTTSRQVSRLKNHHSSHLPSFPVVYRLLLPYYCDEFVWDLHPFSLFTKTTLVFAHCFDTCMYFIQLSRVYHIFLNCQYLSIQVS